MCVIASANWNNSTNAGPWARNFSLLGEVYDQIRSTLNATRSECLGYALITYFKFFGPNLRGIRLTKGCDVDGRSLVAVLLKLVGPVAILRAIVAVVIYPIYGVLWTWWQAHVACEGVKRRGPCLTHLDASTAIVFVKRYFWVCATLLHGSPPMEKRMALDGIWLLYPFAPLDSCLNPQASARLSAAVPQVGGRNVLDRAAVALASPRNPAIGPALALGGYEQSAKSCANQIYCKSHD